VIPVLIATALAGSFADSVDLDRYIYPLSHPLTSPRFTLDVSDAPETKAWGEKAAVLAKEWFPTLTSLLATEGWKAPKEIKFVIKKEISAPAWASGNEITMSGKWIKEHPEDFGMVIHELTHVIQSYPDSDKTPGWLVEGIADYVRWYRYEPDAPRPRVDKVKSKYTDAYRTTAAFLAWVGQKHNLGIVPALDRAMRHKQDPLQEFVRLTGKPVDVLWTDFVATL
jgi:hypothetical protein